jgi:hypothetical protein
MAFRPFDRTATEARVRSPSIGFQLNRLNRSAGAGFEPATRCVSGICSSRLSYPRTDRLFGDKDRFVRRNTDTQSAPRRPGSHEPGPEAERRTRLMHQTAARCKCFLLGLTHFCLQSVARWLRAGVDRMSGSQRLGNYQTRLRAPKIGSCADGAAGLRFRSRHANEARLLERWQRAGPGGRTRSGMSPIAGLRSPRALSPGGSGAFSASDAISTAVQRWVCSVVAHPYRDYLY